MTNQTLTAVFGLLFGLVGVGVNIRGVVEDRPRLRVEIQSLALQASLPISQLPDSLAALEGRFNDVTDLYIIGLQSVARRLTPTDTAELRMFADSVGTIQGVFLRPRDRAHMFGVTRPVPDETARRQQVATALHRLQGTVERLLDRGALRVNATVVVENQSRQPSTIRQDALLRFRGDAGQNRDVALRLRQPVAVQGYSVGFLEFESPLLSTLDSATRSSLVDLSRTNARGVLIVEDLHDRMWTAASRFSQTQLRTDDPTFRKRVDRAFAQAQ